MVCKSKEETNIEKEKLSTVSNTGPEQYIQRNILGLDNYFSKSNSRSSGKLSGYRTRSRIIRSIIYYVHGAIVKEMEWFYAYQVIVSSIPLLVMGN